MKSKNHPSYTAEQLERRQASIEELKSAFELSEQKFPDICKFFVEEIVSKLSGSSGMHTKYHEQVNHRNMPS